MKIKFESTSTKESDKLKWFQGKIPVPEVVGFITNNNSKALLMTAIQGKNLAVLSKVWSAEKVVDKLVDALHKLHSIEIGDWPYDSNDYHKVMVHGDACLSNFIFNNDGLSGYIDLGDAKIDNPEVDLSAAIWSLQYNFGKGYGVQFLEKYGYLNPTEEIV